MSEIKSVKPAQAASKPNILTAIRNVLNVAMTCEVFEVSIVIRYKRPNGEMVYSTFEELAGNGDAEFF
jgi:hypothetical protein